MTFLAIDVGNTRLKWALYSAPRPDAHVLAHGAEFLENIDRLAETDWACLPTPTSMLGCVVAGEAVRRRVQEQMELWDITPQWVVSSAEEAGLTNGYDHPSRLGADRWVAMVGARHRMLAQGAPRPMVVVMVGTAGLKAPTGEAVDFPTNTSDALTSGGTFAIAGACERMYQNLFRHCDMQPLCLMTGGAGWKMLPSMTRSFELVENLIFDGLLLIAEEREMLISRY